MKHNFIKKRRCIKKMATHKFIKTFLKYIVAKTTKTAINKCIYMQHYTNNKKKYKEIKFTYTKNVFH